jgi:hypothetical protein
MNELRHLQEENESLRIELERCRDAIRLTVGFCVDFRQNKDWKNHPEVGLLYSKLSPLFNSFTPNETLSEGYLRPVPMKDVATSRGVRLPLNNVALSAKGERVEEEK